MLVFDVYLQGTQAQMEFPEVKGKFELIKLNHFEKCFKNDKNTILCSPANDVTQPQNKKEDKDHRNYLLHMRVPWNDGFMVCSVSTKRGIVGFARVETEDRLKYACYQIYKLFDWPMKSK